MLGDQLGVGGSVFYNFASLKRLLTEADKKLLKELEDSLEKKRKNLKPLFGECFICQSELHWANNCPKRIKKRKYENEPSSGDES